MRSTGIQAGGGTNLSAGWLKAFELARQGIVDGVNRIVLLTDGHANAGLTDSGALAAMVRSGAESGVSTTCIGFGAGFNEDLLQALGREGRGNYWYVERDDQMAGVFEGGMPRDSWRSRRRTSRSRCAWFIPGVRASPSCSAYPVTRDGRWRMVRLAR